LSGSAANPTISQQLTVDIYAAVLKAGDRGMTVQEIYQQLSLSMTFDNATLLWWREKLHTMPSSFLTFDSTLVGVERIRRQVNSMRTHGVLKSLGNGGSKGSRYVPVRPPKGYRKKMVPNPAGHGHYDIDPNEGRELADFMRDKRTYLETAKVELKKVHSKKLRELVEESIRLLER
jgi:hypothetical protein